MWFRQEASEQPTVSEGASFRRSRGSDIVETAKVLAIAADGVGIPHVRFSLKIQGPRDFAVEERTLALRSFATLYHEPVAF
jgi:hypothetical protein